MINEKKLIFVYDAVTFLNFWFWMSSRYSRDLIDRHHSHLLSANPSHLSFDWDRIIFGRISRIMCLFCWIVRGWGDGNFLFFGFKVGFRSNALVGTRMRISDGCRILYILLPFSRNRDRVCSLTACWKGLSQRRLEQILTNEDY